MMSSEESAAHSKKIGRACEGSKQELLKCLKESDCVKRGMSPKECLGTNATDCGHLQVAFFECKRSLLDNRVRFRGRKGY
ncbi:cytochrome c oxidase assembly factor 5-like [Halichondria panicea]|uniref:cytochrome c oxidase assembly factor 5-like n=1 Tax=Halichondria panicea TaxID=6063 RepID=UPI00312B9B8C